MHKYWLEHCLDKVWKKALFGGCTLYLCRKWISLRKCGPVPCIDLLNYSKLVLHEYHNFPPLVSYYWACNTVIVHLIIVINSALLIAVFVIKTWKYYDDPRCSTVYTNIKQGAGKWITIVIETNDMQPLMLFRCDGHINLQFRLWLLCIWLYSPLKIAQTGVWVDECDCTVHIGTHYFMQLLFGARLLFSPTWLKFSLRTSWR